MVRAKLLIGFCLLPLLMAACQGASTTDDNFGAQASPSRIYKSLTLVTVETDLASETPMPVTSTQTTPFVTMKPLDTQTLTAVPMEELKVFKIISARVYNKLPRDAVWILQDNRIIANDSSRSSHTLQKLIQDYGSEFEPWAVQVSPDGSIVAYVILDRLVIEHLTRSVRWVYQYGKPKEGFVSITSPYFSPDGTALVYSVLFFHDLTFYVKRINLATGEETIIPIDPDAYESGRVDLVDNKTIRTVRTKLRGIKGPTPLTFIPRAWTELGIYGDWVIPGTEARPSRGWLLDPDTGDMSQLFSEGGFLLPSVGGDIVAYTTGEAAEGGYSNNPASKLKAFWFEHSRSAVLLEDEFRLFQPVSWSPDNTNLAYISRNSPREWPPRAFGVINLNTLGFIEMDLRTVTPSVNIRGIAWLDSDRVVVLLREVGGQKAVLYDVDINEFTADQMKMLAEFNLPDDEISVKLLYVPALGQ
ncbi:MAG: hypothetical protein PVG14_20845 [Anaerolineales bacterium]|jgi:hypothetical protein